MSTKPLQIQLIETWGHDASEALRRLGRAMGHLVDVITRAFGSLRHLLPERTRSGRWRVKVLVAYDRTRTVVYRTKALALRALFDSASDLRFSSILALSEQARQ